VRRPPTYADLFEPPARASGRICGADEAGRGPLAGPVVAAAVILDARRPIRGLRDSKELAPARREILAVRIKERAIAWSVALATVEEIDSINILRASLLAMRRAIEALQPAAEYVLVDGNQLPPVTLPARAIIGGDATEPAISAASIIAKVHRDSLMRELDARYPGYGFAHNAGYPTPEHFAALARLGPTVIHRRSFAPVRACYEAGE